MKRAGVVFVVLSAGFLFGCGQPQYTNVDMSPKRVKVIKDFGEDASKMLLKEAKKRAENSSENKRTCWSNRGVLKKGTGTDRRSG
ncbi:MAG: hypothetical protein Q9M89_03900 [Persephonella sp.]|nr:hypothetical protein [Persephonella sp.]